MFWNRNKEIMHTKIGPVLVNPSHPLKEYDTFLELLRDAERYQKDNEPRVEDVLLNLLQDMISDYVKMKNANTETIDK